MGVVAVIGGGIAGHEAAWAARKYDPSCRVLIVQEEPHPLYSACVLADYISGAMPREKVFLLSRDDYRRAGVELLCPAKVLRVDIQCRILELEERTIGFDTLVVATGSKPIVPQMPGVHLQGVCTLKTLSDADRIARRKPGRAVVIGAGPVGVECALALSSRKWEVRLVELLSGVLPRILDEPMSLEVSRVLEQRGIRVLTETKVVSILGEGRVEAVETSEGTLDADLAVLVLGMRPEVTLLKEAGLQMGAGGGVKVDQMMSVGIDGIFACGDCVESLDLLSGLRGAHMLWGNAVRQARVAGTNAAGGKKTFSGSMNVTTVPIGDVAVASMGRTARDLEEKGARLLVREDPFGNKMALVLLEDQIVGVQGMGRLEKVGGMMKALLERKRAQEMISGFRKGLWLGWPVRSIQMDLEKAHSGGNQWLRGTQGKGR
jgi:NADH oxidase (H2O2-forming)